MSISKQILFLIAVVGIIAAGVVGATVINSDPTITQMDFDGIKINVPIDANFEKTSEGYKDSKYGIVINTFNNNNSMIDYLKNTKHAKIISIENQPPQSIAFKKDDLTNIFVTNGEEGVCIGANDEYFVTKMANSVIFSNNHKSEKSNGFVLSQPHMSVQNDFNLILILVANVDTKVFNPTIVENNLNETVDYYNNPIEDSEDDNTSLLDYVDDNTTTLLEDSGDNLFDNDESSSVVESANDNDNQEETEYGGDDYLQSFNDDAETMDSDTNEPLTQEQCEEIANNELNDTDYIVDFNQTDNYYTFIVLNEFNENIYNITVDSLTGELVADDIEY